MIAESYSVESGLIRREVSLGGRPFQCLMEDISGLGVDAEPWERWWRSYLRGARTCFARAPIGYLSIVDLFSGCGGLALGTQEAAYAAGLRPFVRLALDVDREALSVYRANLAPQDLLCADAGSVVDFKVVGWGATARFAYAPEPIHPTLRSARGCTDLVIAGPPCEGHSNLNNKTRRADPRNMLYLDAVGIAVALEATSVVVENVPDVVNDKSQVVGTAIALLHGSGYVTTQGVLWGNELGLPQTRGRFFLVASRRGVADLRFVAKSLRKQSTTVRWAIEDLVDLAERDPVMDSVPSLSSANRARIDYLFENDLHELPDHVRPACHRNGHTYPSVYGRLHWDKPAGTITTGFATPGRGRFIHPSLRRPLTAREAARLQGFPDWFQFRGGSVTWPKKRALAKWIGDAVPPLIGYTAALAAVSGIMRDRA